MKVLLNIFSNEITEQDFLELSEPFNNEGYMVFNFQYPTSDYYLDFINTLVNYLTVEYDINPYETRIIIQSNILNLLISWYRLYNDVIDDFIIVDRHVVYFHSKDAGEELFVNLLSSLAGIEHDHCHDRLYYRYTKPIDIEILKPLIESYQYDLFKPFEDLDIHISSDKKKKMEKEYKYKKWSCKRVTAEDKISYSIDLTEKNVFQNDIQITKINQSSGYFFILYYILTLPIQDMEKAKIAYMLNNRMTVEQKKKVTNYILNYLENNLEEQLPYKLVINLYSFIVMLGQNKNVLNKLLKFIKRDNNDFDNHYAPFTNVLFYITKENQREYEDYFQDRQMIARKLKKYYSSKISIGKCKRSKDKLVIVTGQLLSYNHAPTKITIDYANNLRKYYPNLQIKI